MKTRTTVRAMLAFATVIAGALVLPGAAQAAGTTARTMYYVSLGDSYSVGYQPGLGATPGYAAYVARKTNLKLVNFGCGGATTTSILNGIGCPDVLPHTAGGVTYPTTTQAAAAESFIDAHRGQIGLITITIGGNDVIPCAFVSAPLPCLSTAVTHINTDVSTLLQGLRTAGGSKVRIIGSTYPDVILGGYVYPSVPATPGRVSLANLSVTAFKALVNPALAKAYKGSGAAFVDVTSATGAYIPLTKTKTVPPYGTIPVAVSNVCSLTWFCAKGNIHAKSSGYALIGSLMVARYRSMPKS